MVAIDQLIHLTRSLSMRLASIGPAVPGAAKAEYRFAMAYRRESCLHSGLHAPISMMPKLHVAPGECPAQDIDAADVWLRAEDKDGSSDQRKDRAMTRLPEPWPCAQSQVELA